MCKNKNWKVSFLTIFSIVFYLTSCSFTFHESVDDRKIHNITGNIDFDLLSHQGFMGGSVFYNPDNPSLGQLAEGVVLAARFGYVTKTTVNDDEYVFEDTPSKSQYAGLFISSINRYAISFDVILYNNSGEFLKKSSHTIKTGENADLNDDGFPDIEYQAPIRKRNGLENAVYLNFLSSPETLNTSMFALLPEQYVGGEYPNGIIGINPNGKFIISKYANVENKARSIVMGMQKGDYILDEETGNYQRLVSTPQSRSARAIEDNELETVNEYTESVSYNFTVESFNNFYYSPIDLYMALPESIRNLYHSSESTIENLNNILSYQELIPSIKEVQEIPISKDIYDDVIAQIKQLNELELIQLNRIFLEEVFPEFCPQSVNSNLLYTEILPLVSIKLGQEFKDNNTTAENTARAISLSDYQKRRTSILAKYSQYTQLFTLPIHLDLNLGNNYLNIETGSTSLSVGVKGNFSASWGSVRSDIKTVLLLQADSSWNVKGSFSGIVYNPPKKRQEIPVFGPIALKANIHADMDLPVEVKLDYSGKDIIFLSNYIGLYGAGATIKADYGINWKRKWFISYPVPYMNTSATPWKDIDVAYFMDLKNLGTVNIKDSYISINPRVGAGVGIDFNGIVGADLTFYVGVKPTLNFSCVNNKYTFTPSSKGTTSIDAAVYVNLIKYFEISWPLWHN